MIFFLKKETKIFIPLLCTSSRQILIWPKQRVTLKVFKNFSEANLINIAVVFNKNNSKVRFANFKLFAFDKNKEEFLQSTLISNQLPPLHSLNSFSHWSGSRLPASALSKEVWLRHTNLKNEYGEAFNFVLNKEGAQSATKKINKIEENYMKNNSLKKINNNGVSEDNYENLINPNLIPEAGKSVKKKNKFYTSYSKLSEIKLLTIGIASPLRILQWAEKTLPNGKIYGEVLNANTLHHKTFKPQKGGLFCERIFGPLKDFECACGKINKSNKQLQTVSVILNNMQDSEILNENKNEQKFITNLSRKFCPDCDVEYTWSVIRRYQLGYIKLCSPVTHIWFLKGTPSYLSLLLDMKKRYLQFVTYCSEILTIEKSSIPMYSVNIYYNSNIDYNSSFSDTTFQNSLAKFTNISSSDLLNFKEKEENYEQNSSNFVSQTHEVRTFCCQNFILANSLTNQAKASLIQSYNKNPLIKGKNKPGDQGLASPYLPHLILKDRIKSEHKFEAKVVSFVKLITLLKEKNNKTFNKNNGNVSFAKKKKKVSYFLLYKKSNKQLLLRTPSEQVLTNSSDFVQEKKVGRSQLDNKFLKFLKNLNLIKLSPSSIWRNIPVFLQNNNKQINEGTVIISILLLNLYIKKFDLKDISGNDFFRKLPNIKNILKKLPIDLYIICLLEPMLHKSSLILAIKKTWEYLYKQAFIKSSYKAKNIFYKYLISLKFTKLSKSVLLPPSYTQRISFTGLAKPDRDQDTLVIDPFIFNKVRDAQEARFVRKVKDNVWFSANLQNKYKKLNFKKFILFIQSQQIEDFVKNNQQNDMILKNLKNQYINHLFKLVENIPYEIMSLNYTTSFLQKNEFSSKKKIISSDIRNFLLKKTNYIQKFLIKFFLNSFILDFYFLFIFQLRNSSQNFKTSLNSFFQTSDVQKVWSSIAYDFREAKIKPGNRGASYDQNQVSLASHSKRFATHTRFACKARETKTNAVLNTYKNYIRFSNFMYKDKNNKEIRENFYNSNNFLQNETNLSLNTIQAEVKTTKFLYNNIYTLSHRERWAIEKDWQIFTLFAFGPTNFLDYIIPKYKNRLFALKNAENSSFTFPVFNGQANLTKQTPKEIAETKWPALALHKEGQKETNVLQNSRFSLSFSSSFFSGAGIIQQLLNEFDFYEIKKLDKQNRLILYQLNKSILKLKKQVQIFVYDKNAQIELRELCKKRDLLIRRTKLVRKLFRKNSNPTSMILNLIPVLPPDLRPIVKMGNQIAASDLNRLYQRVIYRNDRLKKFLKDAATSQSYEMKYAQRLLQEAVDNLLQNGKSGSNSEKDSRGRALKSLSDVLKGKQGRFRQFLLGKRVDYSGRSVIVVGPKLKLHECGLPLEMAKELYLPFLLKSLLNKNYAKTVVGAKTLIKNNSSLAHELLREIMQVSPVLLNRAPTLHRLGFQAFVPKLIEGRAILLHPLVCSAFNADFDGDQMAVHVPITVEARAEAWKLMLSKNNLLSTATGDPLAIPSQDMVLGCYYLTTLSNHGKILKGGAAGMFFNSLQDVIKLYEQRLLNIHSLIWVKWTSIVENSNEKENNQSFEIRLSSFGQWQEITYNSYRIYDSYNNLINQYILTTPGRILFNLLIQKIIVS